LVLLGPPRCSTILLHSSNNSVSQTTQSNHSIKLNHALPFPDANSVPDRDDIDRDLEPSLTLHWQVTWASSICYVVLFITRNAIYSPGRGMIRAGITARLARFLRCPPQVDPNCSGLGSSSTRLASDTKHSSNLTRVRGSRMCVIQPRLDAHACIFTKCLGKPFRAKRNQPKLKIDFGTFMITVNCLALTQM
jgi:hypothetical protein